MKTMKKMFFGYVKRIFINIYYEENWLVRGQWVLSQSKLAVVLLFCADPFHETKVGVFIDSVIFHVFYNYLFTTIYVRVANVMCV